MNMEAVSDLLPWEGDIYLFLKLFFCFLGLWDSFYILFAVSALIYVGDNLVKLRIFVYLCGLHPCVAPFII